MNTKNFPLFSICLFAFAFCLVLSTSAQNLTIKEIMQEPSIAGMRIESERLSPDGRSVAYLWNAEGKEPLDLYLVSTRDPNPKKILSPGDLHSKAGQEDEEEDKLDYGVIVNDEFVRTRRGGFGNLRWSPDSTRLLFTQNGDLFILRIGETKPRRLTKTETGESSADYLDNERIMFQQNGNIFSIDTTDGTLTQISKQANPQKNISVFGTVPSKNGEWAAYIVSDGSGQRALFVPNYLPSYTSAPTIRRGWTKPTVYAAKTDGSLDKAIEVELPKADGETYISGLNWAADNASLIVNRVDQTHKRRQLFYIYNIGRKDQETILVTEETDEKWIDSLSRIVEPNPVNAGQLFFSSERDGFGHLYLATLEKAETQPNPTGEIRGENPSDPGFTGKVEIRQMTRGNWQVEWAEWANEEVIVYNSTQNDPKERFIGYFSKDEGSQPSKGSLTGLAGMKTNLQLEGQTLIFSNSNWNAPDRLYSLTGLFSKFYTLPNPKETKLTDTTPETFLKRKWNAPRFVEIPARDTKKIPARFYLPSDFDKSKKHPLVVFVHGAGYLQNVIDGWNNYYREFMFNQLLTQKGYVVLDIDYRGSAGYGRDWRTDVYDFLGGKDYEDHLDAIDFMTANHSVDPNRVGVYGGSYGGFMAAMLVMRAPEKIAAAAALRPVMDWKNYYAANPFYTSQRLGDPKKNPEAYQRSSPIFYADKLERRLLLLHGLLDDNVHAQDSIQLVEKLIRLDKTEHFELMLYPAERHSFQRPASWEDEYERILALFEEKLK